jgi:3-dehydroquinate synthase
VGKNLIGAFYQPRIVLADPQVLLTLPAGEFHGGLAECIKHDIIVDAAGFARLEERLDLILKKDLTALTQLVAHNVGIKASIVAADPFEQGHRAWLNFGHTFAHAIETVSHYQYSHGQAVALGMAAASEASLQLGMIDRSTKLRILRLIERANLPVSGLKLNTDELTAAMLFDKKVRQGKIRFILPTQIGKVIIRDDVPEQIVRAAIESLRGN